MNGQKSSQSGSASCPVSFALETFGDRWTLVVLRDVVLNAQYRYKELLDANPGLATNTLADRLKRLQSRGMVNKLRDAEDARQFLYQPTSIAISLVPMLVEMIVWGAEHGNIPVSRGFIQRFKSDREGLIHELQQTARERAGLA